MLTGPHIIQKIVLDIRPQGLLDLAELMVKKAGRLEENDMVNSQCSSRDSAGARGGSRISNFCHETGSRVPASRSPITL